MRTRMLHVSCKHQMTCRNARNCSIVRSPSEGGDYGPAIVTKMVGGRMQVHCTGWSHLVDPADIEVKA